MRADIYRLLRSFSSSPVHLQLLGLGNNNVSSLESLSAQTEIDNNIFQTIVYIISSSNMSNSMIADIDIILKGILTFN